MAKTKVPIAVQPRHKFPLHSGHVTTSSFMRFDLGFARELAPCKIKFNHQEVVRTMAMKRPLYSNIMLHNTAIFVPFRTVWEPWTDFKVDTPHNQPAGTGIIANVPLISEDVLAEIFCGIGAPGFISRVATAAELAAGTVDWVSANSSIGYFLSPYGKWAMSLLNQLHYRVDPFATKGQTVSALPLLCAAKAYLDFYYPNGYAHYGIYATLDGIMQRQVSYGLTKQEILDIFALLYKVAYSDDYFVNAFDNPAGPNDYVGSVDFVLKDITVQGSNAIGDDTSVVTNFDNNGVVLDGTPVLQSLKSGIPDAVSAPSNISQYQIDNLRRLTSYVQRHRLAGSRSLERYLLDFGVALDADKLKRSIKIDQKRFPLQVGEVMSQSDTFIPASGGNPAQGAQLGDYSGRAVAYDGDLNFTFETEEFGYLFIISTIIPSVSYVQGRDRSVVHKTKFDFLTGNFDGLVTAIDSGELFIGMRRDNYKGSPFGFTGNYPEYKTARDTLSGLFLFPYSEAGLLGWETCRMFSDEIGDNPFNITHSLDFMLGGDSDQYNRIFMDDSEADKFVIVHRDNFEIEQNALPLYDFFDWYDDDHIKIGIDVNGTKTN